MIQPFWRYISTSNRRCPSLLIPVTNANNNWEPASLLDNISFRSQSRRRKCHHTLLQVTFCPHTCIMCEERWRSGLKYQLNLRLNLTFHMNSVILIISGRSVARLRPGLVVIVVNRLRCLRGHARARLVRWAEGGAPKSSIRRFVITEKAPTRVESGYYRFHI